MSPEAKIACYQIACDAAVEAYVVSRISRQAKAILLGEMKPSEWPTAVGMLEEFGLIKAKYPDERPFGWVFSRTPLGKRVRDRLREDAAT